MALTLNDVRRIARDEAEREHSNLEVIGAVPAEGESTRYTELVLTVRGCDQKPCRLIVGLNREATEAELRASVRGRLREHLLEHRSADKPVAEHLRTKR